MSTELVLGPHHGMQQEYAAYLVDRLCTLELTRLVEAGRALRAAVDG